MLVQVPPSASRTGLDPEGVLLSEGKIHWTAVQSGEGEGYQVKTVFAWRARSQPSTATKLWITTELSGQKSCQGTLMDLPLA